MGFGRRDPDLTWWPWRFAHGQRQRCSGRQAAAVVLLVLLLLANHMRVGRAQGSSPTPAAGSLAVVEAFFAALNQRDLDRAFALYAVPLADSNATTCAPACASPAASLAPIAVPWESFLP